MPLQRWQTARRLTSRIVRHRRLGRQIDRLRDRMVHVGLKRGLHTQLVLGRHVMSRRERPAHGKPETRWNRK